MNKTATPFRFGLDVLDHSIVESLRYSLETVMPEIINDYSLWERLACGQFRWNVIIAQLREQCQHLGWIDLGICKRGSWKTPVLFHPATRNIITFMTETTFRDVQHRKNKGTHYLCGCANFNSDVQPQAEQLRMELPPVVDSEKWIAKSQEQLASSVHLSVGDIEGHILVLFDTREDVLLSVRAVRLTKDLEISIEEEDWTYLIRTPYSSNNVVIPLQNDDDEEEDLVTLRE